jgi:CheY-like chemotaxis protein
MDIFKEKAIGSGMNRYLTKPITIMDLEALLKDLQIV